MNSTDYTLKLMIEAQDKFSAELSKLENQLESIEKQTKATSNTADSLLSWIKSWIAKLWLTALITKTTTSIINLADSLEQSKIAFTTMLWSAEDAEVMLNNLSDFAMKTPFELQWIRSNAQQLLAMWVQANDIVPTLKSLWDVASWLSVPLERLALNYWQVIAQWKLTWRELRDFTMAWVPLLDELSQMLWKSTSQIQDMISKWQISSNDVVSAFQNMTSEWWKFADLMWKQATTLSWLRSNLKDNLSRIWEEVWTALLPTLKWYVTQIEERTAENKDLIIEVAQEIFDTVQVLVENIISAWSEIRWVVQSIVSDIWTVVTQLATFISWTDDETTSWIKWDWSDVFYYLKLWFAVVTQTVKLAVTTIYSYIKFVWKARWDIAWMMWWIFSALRSDVKNWALNMAEWAVNAVVKMVNWMIDKINRLSTQIEDLTWLSMWLMNTISEISFWWWETWRLSEQISTLWTLLKEDFTELTSTVSDSFNDWLNAVIDVYVDRVDKVREETNWIVDSANELKKSLSWLGWWLWLWDDDTISSWGSGSKKKKKDELEEEMKAYWKQTKKILEENKKRYKSLDDYSRKRLKDQADVLDDLNKEYEDKFDKIQSKIKDTQKEIKSLSKDIEDLNKSLAWLVTDENKSIASTVVESQKWLKALEREYEWISDIAKSVSFEQLDEQWIWYIEWYSVDKIREAKNYIENLNSMYEWMTEDEQQALDKEIEYAQRYDSLNWVQKIKEDYRIKKQQVQEELDAKKNALEEETTKLNELNETKKQLQQERMENIEKEEKRYYDMYEAVKIYEDKYIKKFETDYYKQKSMIEDLEKARSKVASVKDRALSHQTEVEWKATWWYVAWWTPYLVWEEWPELFVPKSNWTIVPNNEITNNNWITINLNWLSVRSEADIDAVTNEIIRKIKLEKSFWIA